MPPARSMDQTAPFWDFVAQLQEQGFGPRGGDNPNPNTDNANPWTHPWAQQGWPGSPFGGPFAHRGRHAPQAPSEQDGSTPQQQQQQQQQQQSPRENDGDATAGPSDPSSSSEHAAPPPAGPSGPRGGRCGGRGRGRGGWGGAGRGGGGGGGRGRCGPGPAGGFPPMMGGFGAALAQMMQEQLFEGAAENKAAGEGAAGEDDFTPEADVFDTPDAYVVHVSLAGAKREDVGVEWDAEKSELRVAGVVYRAGGEELSQALTRGERKVGAFERKVRLGVGAGGVQVDGEAITARMEEGVLTVQVPKLGDGGFVEVRKVDIE